MACPECLFTGPLPTDASEKEWAAKVFEELPPTWEKKSKYADSCLRVVIENKYTSCCRKLLHIVESRALMLSSFPTKDKGFFKKGAVQLAAGKVAAGLVPSKNPLKSQLGFLRQRFEGLPPKLQKHHFQNSHF